MDTRGRGLVSDRRRKARLETHAPRRRGRFIVLEGIDGAGKTTVAAELTRLLRARHRDVMRTMEPTESPTGRAVRAAIEADEDPVSTTMLFVADRLQHAGAIEQALAAGRDVVCDRFVHSTLAYQGVTLAGRVPDARAWLEGLHEHLRLHPDVVLLLDIPAEASVARAEARGATDPFEKKEFLEKVRAAYLELAEAEPDVFRVVDATGSHEEVVQAAVAAVEDVLGPEDD